jgi:hypothetical protein
VFPLLHRPLLLVSVGFHPVLVIAWMSFFPSLFHLFLPFNLTFRAAVFSVMPGAIELRSTDGAFNIHIHDFTFFLVKNGVFSLVF